VQPEGPRARGSKPRFMRRVTLVLTVLALAVPLALATSAFAQEPEPPGGGPQTPTTTPTTPTTTSPTGGQQPTTTGQLPRTGWDAALYFALGVILLLAGARLRVLTRIKQVVQRVRRRNTEVALREALEPIRAARLSPPKPDPDRGPLHVEPSTPTARRMTGVAPPLDIDY
jgi:hypothetical protein